MDNKNVSDNSTAHLWSAARRLRSSHGKHKDNIKENRKAADRLAVSGFHGDMMPNTRVTDDGVNTTSKRKDRYALMRRLREKTVTL